jgi:hypothetical protein
VSQWVYKGYSFGEGELCLGWTESPVAERVLAVADTPEPVRGAEPVQDQELKLGIHLPLPIRCTAVQVAARV